MLHLFTAQLGLRVLSTTLIAHASAMAIEVPAHLGEPLREVDGCKLYKLETQADGVAPMLARCEWPAVDPERLAELLARFEDYEYLIYGITSCDVREVVDGRSLVFQEQWVNGLASRQVLLWMQEESHDDGSRRFTWHTAGDRPLEVPRGMVRPPRNEGWWHVRARPEGGALVEHAIAYDPGGSVPAWLVRQFQTGGLARVMREVRAMAIDRARSSDG